jgi:glycerol dehydrogenase
MCYAPLLEYGIEAKHDCEHHIVSTALEQAVLANIVSTGLVSLSVLDCYNCAVAHSVYYGLVVLPGFEEKWLHGNVVAYGVLVQLLIDGDVDEARRLKAFMQELEMPTTLREMDVPVDRTVLQPVLTETVTGPDMEHIPYPITEDMVFEAMVQVEML